MSISGYGRGRYEDVATRLEAAAVALRDGDAVRITGCSPLPAAGQQSTIGAMRLTTFALAVAALCTAAVLLAPLVVSADLGPAIGSPIPAASGLVGATLAGLGGAPGPDPAIAHARSAGVDRHRVAQRWRVVFSDVLRGADEIVDTWDVRGAPLGRARVTTRTPRDQASEPIRTPSFSMRTGRGSLHGHLRVKKTYLETTPDHQLAKFEGTGSFEAGTLAFAGASGRIRRVAGTIDCFADSTCEGHLTVTGTVSY